MTVKLSSLKVDIKAEKEGDWVNFPDWDGVRFKVSSQRLPAFQIARDMAMKRLTRQHKGDTIPSDTTVVEMGKLMAKHLLHDWEGLDVAYSPDVAAEILSDIAYRPVIAAVHWCTEQVGTRDVEFIEEEGKNSEKPSAGG